MNSQLQDLFVTTLITIGMSVSLTSTSAIAQQTASPASAVGSNSPKQVTSPRQGWAHLDGLAKLDLHTKPITADQLVARQSIEDAFARWGIAYDEARLDVVRTLFTKDAIYKVSNGSYKPGGEVVGIDAIVTTVANALKGQADQRRHAISNVVIDKLTDTQASALAYGIVTVAADGLTLGATVIYSADLRREPDGVWRFSRFVIGMDHYAGRLPNAAR